MTYRDDAKAKYTRRPEDPDSGPYLSAADARDAIDILADEIDAKADIGQLPTVSTDNRVARFDGTEGALQGSPVSILDTGRMTGLADGSGATDAATKGQADAAAAAAAAAQATADAALPKAGGTLTGRVRFPSGGSGGFEIGASGPLRLAGTGSPQGTVTAPPGSTWTQTDDATLGALVWFKATGTGNTGWLPDYQGRMPWARVENTNIVKASDGWAGITLTGTTKGIAVSGNQFTVPAAGLYLITVQADPPANGRAVIAYERDAENGAYSAGDHWIIDTGTPNLATNLVQAGSALIDVTSTLRLFGFLTTGTHAARAQVACVSTRA